MRLKNKDMSLIPEFRVSQNVEKYINSSDGYLASNTASFGIFGVNQENTETVSYTEDGGSTNTYDIKVSENTPQNSGEQDFYRIYSFSDFMESFTLISDDHDSYASENFEKSISLTCKTLKKFIAYDGFYPAERTLEIGKDFTDVYRESIKGKQGGTSAAIADNLKMRPILAPLFSPGILFNTIKSGIAVDYPVYTGSFEKVRYLHDASSLESDYYAVGIADGDMGKWHYRVNFEKLLDPSELVGIDFVDMEPHPSCSLNVTSSISIAPNKKNKYNLAINNFLASTVDFFMKDEELTSLVSQGEENYASVSSSKKYGLRIKMRRSTRGQKREDSSWPTPQEYISAGAGANWTTPTVSPSFKITAENYRMFTLNMYSRPSAFGPPIAGSGSFDVSLSWATPTPLPAGQIPLYYIPPDQLPSDALYGFNVSHTPPYYNGESWVDIIYSPTVDGKPTIDDIQANSEIVCWRIDGYDPDTWPSGDAGASAYPMHSASVNNYAMQLTSSINIFNKLFEKSDEKPDENSPSWAIQTKFETPVLNFGPYGEANYSETREEFLDGITLPFRDSQPWSGSSGQTTTPIGMWHQFGTIPSEENGHGIFLEIEDIDESWLSTRAREADISSKYDSGQISSLVDIVGFNKTERSKKIGQLAESKTVFEAVVAIPFVDVQDIRKTRSLVVKPNQTNRNFFELPTTKDYSQIIAEMAVTQDSSQIKDLFPSDIDQSIIEMSEKIKDRYVFPPEFDFFRNKNARPIAMYIFDFEHTFDKNDLSYIWQNIAPKIGNEFQEASATISHPLLTKNNLLEDLKDRVKWMVFKVKQRAKTKYNNLLIGGNEREELFSYNWPYDYFSLIEFAKIDSSITYGSIEATTSQITSPDATTGLPPAISTDISIGNTTTTADSKQTQLTIDAQLQSNIKTVEREKK